MFAAVTHEVYPGNSFDSESEKNLRKRPILEIGSFKLRKNGVMEPPCRLNGDPGLKIISKILASIAEMHPKVFVGCIFCLDTI